MHVAHYCHRFSALSETFIYDQLSALGRQGVENAVVTHYRENADRRPFGNVTVAPWPGLLHPARLGCRALDAVGLRAPGTSAWPLVRRRLRKALQGLAPDVVHAHFGPRGVLVAPAAARLAVPLVVSCYGHDVSRLPRREAWRTRYRKLWHAARAVVVLSEDMKTAVRRLGCPAGKIHVVHLGRDLEAFPFRLPEGAVRHVVSVGRLTEKKGHRDALRVVQRLRAAGHDVHLRVIGGGELHEALAAFVRRYGLEANVALAGPQSADAVGQALREADAFLLCSKTAPDGDREGTPTVLVEAQASGLPCVATRHAGIPEMIPAENHAWLAQEGDVDGLAARLERLVEASVEERRTIARSGRAKVEADFNLKREAEKLRGVYERATAPAQEP